MKLSNSCCELKSCEIRAAFSLKVEIKNPENDAFDVYIAK